MTSRLGWREGAVPKKSDGIEAVELDGRLVLWHRGRMHRLDAVGSDLWRRFDGRRTLGSIARECATSFDVHRVRALEDLIHLCEVLEAQGLVDGHSAVPEYIPTPRPGPTPVIGPGDPPLRHVLDSAVWVFESRPFEAIGHRFRIRSTDRSVGRYLEEVLGSLARDAPADQWYSIVELPALSGSFGVFLGNTGLTTVPDARGAVRHTLWHVNSEAVRTCTNRLVLHASAAAVGGKAILMPGTINAGKSTLVAGLAWASFDYLTDELAVIDPRTLLVEPYPRPLNLGADVWDVVPHLRPRSSEPELAASFRTWHLNPGSIARTRISPATPVGFLIAPRYEPNGGTTLERMPRDEALQLLVDQSMNLHRFGRQGFRSLVSIVKAAECFRLQLDSLPNGVEAVRNVAEGRHRS